MTTRLTAANGEHLDVDEETQCVAHTHLDDSPVVSRVFLGPTPPKADKKPAPADPAVRRAELLAELDALGAE